MGSHAGEERRKSLSLKDPQGAVEGRKGEEGTMAVWSVGVAATLRHRRHTREADESWKEQGRSDRMRPRVPSSRFAMMDSPSSLSVDSNFCC